MDLTLRIPDDLARRLGKESELSRGALEGFALGEDQAGHRTRPELRHLLGFETGAGVDGFLKARGADESMTAAKLERDRQDLDRLGV